MDEKMYELAKTYYEKHGILSRFSGADTRDNELFNYLKQLKNLNEQGLIDAETKSMFNKIGMMWTKEDEKNAKWNYCYNLLKQYSQMYGTLAMPSKCEIKGVALHSWLEEQKAAYASGELSIGRAEKLGNIGVEWDAKNKSDHISLDEAAIAYYVGKAYPDAISSYTPEWLNGKEVDIYIPSLNIGIEFDGSYHKNRKTFEKDLEKNKLCKDHGMKLTRVRVPGLPKMISNEYLCVIQAVGAGRKSKENTIKQVLQSIGVKNMPEIDTIKDKYAISCIVAESKSYFNQYMMAAKHYLQEHGHLFVKQNYKDPTGLNLGKWIHDIRSNKDFLTERQINALDDIGMVWGEINKEKWLFNFDKATSFEKIPEHETTVDGKPLKEWFEEEVEDYRNEMVFSDYKLEALNLWDKEIKQKQAEKCRESEKSNKQEKIRNKNRSSDEMER